MIVHISQTALMLNTYLLRKLSLRVATALATSQTLNIFKRFATISEVFTLNIFLPHDTTIWFTDLRWQGLTGLNHITVLACILQLSVFDETKQTPRYRTLFIHIISRPSKVVKLEHRLFEDRRADPNKHCRFVTEMPWIWLIRRPESSFCIAMY